MVLGIKFEKPKQGFVLVQAFGHKTSAFSTPKALAVIPMFSDPAHFELHSTSIGQKSTRTKRKNQKIKGKPVQRFLTYLQGAEMARVASYCPRALRINDQSCRVQHQCRW